jgi:hypothetical protein
VLERVVGRQKAALMLLTGRRIERVGGDHLVGKPPRLRLPGAPSAAICERWSSARPTMNWPNRLGWGAPPTLPRVCGRWPNGGRGVFGASDGWHLEVVNQLGLGPDPTRGPTMSAHAYSPEFYDYISGGSRASARAVTALLGAEMAVDSVLDVGGGNGVWCREWLRRGVATVLSVDGDYVRTDQLVIAPELHRAHDLATPIDLGRQFDLVQSLEVAEHIEPDCAAVFIGNLVGHGDVVMFSAAVPNQGGEYHLNEQPHDYWRGLFAHHGYEPYDWLRPALAGDRSVKPWYRYNSFLYANAAGAARLSAAVRESRVAPGVPLASAGDWRWALRRATVSIIPADLVKTIAMAKAAAEVRLKTSGKSNP